RAPELRDKAAAAGKFGDAISAEVSRGKALGYYIERREIRCSWSFPGEDEGRGRTRLARVLKAFSIVPGTIRLSDGTTPKGYLRQQLENVFVRFLPEPPQRHKPTGGAIRAHRDGTMWRLDQCRAAVPTCPWSQ